MKLFGLNLGGGRRREAASAAVVHKSFGGAVDWLRGEETGSVFANAYQQVVWVYRAINVLAEQVANVPFLFSVGERGRENLVTGGALAEFYSRPHPQIDRFQYWELRIIWLMLRGE
jgi:phage portal protein BeeE